MSNAASSNDSPAASEAVATATAGAIPSVRTAALSKPPRVYFYRMDEHGRVVLDEASSSPSSSPSSSAGLLLGLRDTRTLNIIMKNLRTSAGLLASEQRLRDRLDMPVPVAAGSALTAATAASSSLPATVPLSAVPAAYPYVSLCAGELNFLRCDVLPVVFHTLLPPTAASGRSSSSSSSDHQLVYGGDCTMPFNPASLCVDNFGRLFHAFPLLEPATTSSTAVASSSSTTPTLPSAAVTATGADPSSPAAVTAAAPLPLIDLGLGLVSSHLALELELREVPFSRAEMDYCVRVQEDARRMAIELTQQAQATTSSGSSANEAIERFVTTGLQAALARGTLRRTLSRFVCVWKGRSHRIALIEGDIGCKPAANARLNVR
jgi:hypothetical protein